MVQEKRLVVERNKISPDGFETKYDFKYFGLKKFYLESLRKNENQ